MSPSGSSESSASVAQACSENKPFKIYLAGPEVFLPNPDQIGAQKKALCEAYGFQGLFPLDSELSAQALQGSARDLGMAISAANEDLIRSCDLLIANLTPFRGSSADVGTVYELGLARGLGKPVYGYSNCITPYLERVWQQFGVLNPISNQPAPLPAAGDIRDRDGYKIEEFDLHDNLMIEGGIELAGGKFHPVDQQGRLEDLSGFEALLKTLQKGSS